MVEYASIGNKACIIRNDKHIVVDLPIIVNDKKWYDATIKLQSQKAIQWCKKYNIAYN